MRNLTIHRTKTFIACLATMKVYIEDPNVCDLVINGLPCRKLGTLKNGETKTFEIGDHFAKLFVIIDRFSKGYCNEFYNIPAGTEDIELSGKNEFNLVTSNAFRFDGVTDPEVLENRKKNKNKGRMVLIGALLLGMVLGVVRVLGSSDPVSEKVFTKEGMTITLTSEFKENTMDGFVACYESVDVAVFVSELTFDTNSELANYTLQEYAEALYMENKHDLRGDVQSENGLTFYEYQYHNSNDGITYYYFTYVYKTEGSFWIVQFATPAVEVTTLREDITQWAKSVTFEG